MKIAILGTGFGAYHAELYTKMPEAEKVVVWGRNAEKLKELQAKFPVDTTTDLEAVWGDSEIDLVDVCLPNHLHKEAAIKALRAGKHVFIETPIAETIEDARAILNAAEQYRKRVFVDLFLRFEFAYDYLYRLKKSKVYGRLVDLQVKRETPPWWGNLDSGHIGLNLMMHDMDFIVRLMGEADGIFAGKVDVRERQSIVNASLQYADAHARIRGASSMPDTYPFSVGYEAFFEHAAVRYYEDGYADGRTETKLELFCGASREEIPLRQADCYEAVLRSVLDCIKSGQASCLDGKEAVRTLSGSGNEPEAEGIKSRRSRFICKFSKGDESEMMWMEILQNAVDYIEEHLLEDINFEDVAKQVNLSPYEFHRAFSFLAGMTMTAYLRNRRLSLAGRELAETNQRIVDVAMKYGFETQDGFAKAFTRFHGVAPKYAKVEGTQLTLFNPLRIKLSFEGGKKVDYRIERKGKQRFVAAVKGFPTEIIHEDDNHDIADFWEACYAQKRIEPLKKLQRRDERKTFGLCAPIGERETSFAYGIGVLPNDEAQAFEASFLKEHGYRVWETAPCTYAVFPCRGNDGSCITEAWERFYREFLPQSGYQSAVATDYEVYFDQGEEGLFCELWIPIQK